MSTPNTIVMRLGQLASQLNEDAHRFEDIAYHHQAEDVEDAAKCVEALQLLRRASNWSHFASVVVVVDGKPITTIGNIIAEAVGGLDQPCGTCGKPLAKHAQPGNKCVMDFDKAYIAAGFDPND